MRNLSFATLKTTRNMIVADAFDEYLDNCEFDELIAPDEEQL